MAVLPSDHHIPMRSAIAAAFRAALELARAPGNLVVLGIPPSRPETGFGYIESAKIAARPRGASGVRGQALYGKAGAVARAKICGFREVFLERGHVLLARIDVSRRAAPISAEDARGARRARQDDRHSALRLRTAPHLSAARKYFGGLRHHGAGHATGQRDARLRDSRGSGLERHRLLGSRLRTARGQARGECFGGAAFRAGCARKLFLEPKKFVAAIGVRDLVLVETDDALLCAHAIARRTWARS